MAGLLAFHLLSLPVHKEQWLKISATRLKINFFLIWITVAGTAPVFRGIPF